MRSSGNSRGEAGGASDSKTEDQKCNSGNSPAKLFIIGIGPGSIDHMSCRAVEAVKSADTIAGYTVYVDLIKTLIAGKKIVSTTMKKEVDRVQAAIEIAMGGESCAIVSSGDSGIYAMAGLAFEICKKNSIEIIRPGHKDHNGNCLEIEVIPGIPALASGGALLGAPLTHDFACVSLSDLLTPWELIEKRLEGAAMADFVIVLFNPKSKKRDWQLSKAQEIVLKYRDKNTPVGIVKNAMRQGQDVTMVKLGDLHEADVDMLTTVFIGSSASVEYMDFMITPRGYSGKYNIG